MIKISKKLFIELIMNGEDKGAGFGKIVLKDGKAVPVNFYDRSYKDTLFHLIEIEETDEFYALEESDKVITDSKEAKDWDNTMTGLKNTLTDVVDILKSIKEDEKKEGDD